MTAIWKICSGMPWISKNNSPKPSPTSHLSEVLTPIDPYLVWVRQGRPRGIFVGWKLWFVGGIRLKSWWICRGIFNILYKWLKTGLDWILRSVLKGFSVLNDHDFARVMEGAVLLSTPGESSHQTIMSRLQGTLVFERESFKHIMCIYIQYVPVLLACWCVLEISRLHLLFSTFSSFKGIYHWLNLASSLESQGGEGVQGPWLVTCTTKDALHPALISADSCVT